jgi:Ca2+:H+ antiporter
MPFTVNHFRIKRQAHALSRHESNWNPFSHTWTLNRSRRGTWDGNLEAQNGDIAEEPSGEPIHHAQTEPGTRSRGFTDDDTVARVNSEPEVREPKEGSTPQQPDSGLRNRSSGKEADPGTQSTIAPEEKVKEKKPHRLFKNVRPKEPFTVGNQIRRTLLNSWINVLLLAAPVGIALNYVPNVSKVVVFVVNFIAIIPLAALLSFATEEIALRVGETLGGLLNATFG